MSNNNSYLTTFIKDCLQRGITSPEALKIEASTLVDQFQQDIKKIDQRKQELTNKLTGLYSIVSNASKTNKANSLKSYQLDPKSSYEELPFEIQEICKQIVSLFVDTDYKTARSVMDSVGGLSKQTIVYSSLSWLESNKFLSRNPEKGYCQSKYWKEKIESISNE